MRGSLALRVGAWVCVIVAVIAAVAFVPPGSPLAWAIIIFGAVSGLIERRKRRRRRAQH
jgi:hypothetical protein